MHSALIRRTRQRAAHFGSCFLCKLKCLLILGDYIRLLCVILEYLVLQIGCSKSNSGKKEFCRASRVLRSGAGKGSSDGNQPVFVCDLPHQFRVLLGEGKLGTQGGSNYILLFLGFFFFFCWFCWE
jgi:hypothetical protein